MPAGFRATTHNSKRHCRGANTGQLLSIAVGQQGGDRQVGRCDLVAVAIDRITRDVIRREEQLSMKPDLFSIIINSWHFELEVASGDLYHALENTRFVIGSASGAFLGAILRGISWIISSEPRNVYFSHIPEIGRRLLRAELSSAAQVLGSATNCLCHFDTDRA